MVSISVQLLLLLSSIELREKKKCCKEEEERKINLSTVAISLYQVTLIKLIVDYNKEGNYVNFYFIFSIFFSSLVSLHDNFIRQFNYFFKHLFLYAFIEGICDTQSGMFGNYLIIVMFIS